MSNRWLIGAGAIIALLVAASILVALSRGQKDMASYPANSPEGTVQRFLQAVMAKKYSEAYVYLSDDLKKYCTAQNLADSTSYTRDQDMRVSLAGSQPIDSQVQVEVRISQVQMGQPFTPSEYSYTQRFTLTKQGEGDSAVWQFAQPPWPMSYCPGWETQKPVPAAPPIRPAA